MFQATSQAATQAMAYSMATGITSLIGLIGFGIYLLIHYVVKTKNRSQRQSDETEPESKNNPASETESELLAEAAAKSLQLNTAALEAAKRMNDAASGYKDTEF